jgi:hypothetical protein
VPGAPHLEFEMWADVEAEILNGRP